MKNIVLIFIGIVLLFSCRKKEPLPSQTYGITNDTSKIDVIHFYGKYRLYGGYMYVTNNETGEKTKYNHFSSSKTTSSLRWGAPIYDIEVIIKDSTTYEFLEPFTVSGIGIFVLNGDTSKHYNVQYNKVFSSDYSKIIEDMRYREQNMGGSCRPFLPINLGGRADSIKIIIENTL